MSVFFDVLIVVVIAFSIIRYGIKGFVQALLGFGKFIASVLVASAFGKPVAAWISDGFMRKWISDGVYEKICEYIVDGQSLSEFFNNIPDGFIALVKLFGAEIDTLQQKYATAEASDAVIREMANTITAPIADTTSAIIAYVLIFVITLIVISIIALLLKTIKIPILTGIDKLLGCCLGLLIGFFSAAMISTVIYTVLELISAVNGNAEIMNYYDGSIVFKFIHEFNIFNFIRSLI